MPDDIKDLPEIPSPTEAFSKPLGLENKTLNRLDLLEQKMNMIRDELMETKDMMLVNQLDVINLKNDIEKMSLTDTGSPSGSAGPAEALHEIRKRFEKLDDVNKELEDIKKDIKNVRSEKGEKIDPSVFKKIDDLEKEIKAIKSIKEGKPDKSLLEKMNYLESRLESIKTQKEIKQDPDLLRKIKTIERTVSAANKKSPSAPQLPIETLIVIEELAQKMVEKTQKIDKIDNILGEIEGMKEDIGRLKTIKSLKPPIPPKNINFKEKNKAKGDICKHCGAKVPKIARFCGNCGKKV